MASTISAGTTSGTSIAIAGDTSGQLQLRTNGTTTAVTVDTSQNVGIGTSSPSTKLQVVGTTKIGATGTNGVLQLARTSDGATITNFQTDGTSGIINSAVSTTFEINTVEAMRISSDGGVGINFNPAGNARFVVQADGSAQPMIRLYNSDTGSASQNFISFRRNNVDVGSISGTNTATSYNTSSDYRLKENIAPMTGALATVSALKPVTYKWKVNGSDGQGFIAHELAEVVPECVTGEKDGMRTEQYEVSPAIPATYDEEGNELTPAVEAVMGEREVPAYQGIDTSFLVAKLTAALQELNAKVEAQAVRIAELEGAK